MNNVGKRRECMKQCPSGDAERRFWNKGGIAFRLGHEKFMTRNRNSD